MDVCLKGEGSIPAILLNIYGIQCTIELEMATLTSITFYFCLMISLVQ